MATGLLDLPQDQFMGALDELGIAGARRDELIRAKRNQDSMFGGLFDFFAPQPGMERANLLPMMRPQGMSGLDAITSGQAQLAMPGMFTGALAGLAQAADAPRAAAQGQIPMQDMAGEAANVAGLLTLGGAAAGPGLFNYDPNVAGMGFRLYQGSPHDFNAERLVRMPDGSTQYIVGRPDVLPDVPPGAEVLRDFPLGRQRMDKIGTGEGAQAYGYGLYGAEAEGVARGYRDALSARAAPNDARGNAFDLVQRMGGDEAATAEILRDAIANTPSPNTQQFLTDTLRHIEEKTYSDFERPLGRMYELNVNANPEDFLDWDLPLSQQPKSVRDALGPRVDALRQAGAGLPQDPVGEMLWRVAHPQGGFDKTDFSRSVPEQATERLRQAGIPGIRYLDAGSRGAGDGSRNYVVFDENLIEIVRKYGIAGAAAMLGMSQADVAQAMQQQPQPQGLLAGPQ